MAELDPSLFRDVLELRHLTAAAFDSPRSRRRGLGRSSGTHLSAKTLSRDQKNCDRFAELCSRFSIQIFTAVMGLLAFYRLRKIALPVSGLGVFIELEFAVRIFGARQLAISRLELEVDIVRFRI